MVETCLTTDNTGFSDPEERGNLLLHYRDLERLSWKPGPCYRSDINCSLPLPERRQKEKSEGGQRGSGIEENIRRIEKPNRPVFLVYTPE